MKVALIIGATLVALALIGNRVSPAEDTATAAAVERVEAAEAIVTPEMVMDVILANDPSAVVSFCAAYVVVGDRDLAFGAFSQAYTNPSPSAEEVFNEFLSRC